MKKLLTIALFIIPFLGFSQTTKPIEGFLGIKFGSSKADVIAAVTAKGGTLDSSSDNEKLFFDNIKLGQRLSSTFQVQLIDNKAYFGGYIFHAENDPQTEDYYKSLVKDMSEIYGPGNSQRIFKAPYKDGGDDEIAAIEGGYASIYTNWVNDNKRITIYINSKLQIILIYQDDVLMREADARAKAKAKGDF
jgi:hypothetical protein